MSLRSGFAWVEQGSREGGDFREGGWSAQSPRPPLWRRDNRLYVCVVHWKHWEAFEPLAFLNHILAGWLSSKQGRIASRWMALVIFFIFGFNIRKREMAAADLFGLCVVPTYVMDLVEYIGVTWCMDSGRYILDL